MQNKKGVITNYNGYYGKIITDDNEEFIFLNRNVLNDEELHNITYSNMHVEFVYEPSNNKSMVKIARFVKADKDYQKNESERNRNQI